VSRLRRERQRDTAPSRGFRAYVQERRWPLAVLLAALALALYWPATRNGFVAYDDDVYVTGNPHVRDGIHAETFAWALTSIEASNWHPLTWLSHALDSELYGLEPAGHHLTSVLIHALNAALLFLVLRQLTGAVWRSALVAALFAVHPLNVESVAWVAERKTVLCTLFWLLTLLAYGRHARAPGWISYLGVVAGLALALMSKAMAVTLPCVLALLDVWPLSRWTGRRSSSKLAASLLEKLPLFAMAAGASVLAVKAQAAAGSIVGVAAIPWSARLANALVSYLAYVEKTVWPSHLAVFYPHPVGSLPAARVALALVTVAAASALAFAWRRRAPWLPIGWLWYLGTLVPVIGLVQVGTQAMADRYAYIPLIGLFLILAWGAAAAASRAARGPQIAAAMAGAVLLGLSLATLRQIGVWRDSLTLFESTVRSAPDAWLAHYNLGNAYADQGREADAASAFRETIRLSPRFARAHNNLGKALDALGRSPEAMASYREAIRLKPELAEAHNNLGVDEDIAGDREAAIASFREAIRRNPGFVEARVNLGIALREQGRWPEALQALDEAVELGPGYAPARYQRGLVLLRTGRPDAARSELRALEGLDAALAARLAAALDEAGR